MVGFVSVNFRGKKKPTVSLYFRPIRSTRAQTHFRNRKIFENKGQRRTNNNKNAFANHDGDYYIQFCCNRKLIYSHFGWRAECVQPKWPDNWCAILNNVASSSLQITVHLTIAYTSSTMVDLFGSRELLEIHFVLLNFEAIFNKKITEHHVENEIVSKRLLKLDENLTTMPSIGCRCVLVSERQRRFAWN